MELEAVELYAVELQAMELKAMELYAVGSQAVESKERVESRLGSRLGIVHQSHRRLVPRGGPGGEALESELMRHQGRPEVQPEIQSRRPRAQPKSGVRER